jgi:hypothetical protein
VEARMEAQARSRPQQVRARNTRERPRVAGLITPGSRRQRSRQTSGARGRPFESARARRIFCGRIGRLGARWANQWPKPLFVRPMESATRLREKCVERDAVLALAAVEQLRGRCSDPSVCRRACRTGGHLGPVGSLWRTLSAPYASSSSRRLGVISTWRTPRGVLRSAIHTRAPSGPCRRTPRSRIFSVSEMRGPA